MLPVGHFWMSCLCLTRHWDTLLIPLQHEASAHLHLTNYARHHVCTCCIIYLCIACTPGFCRTVLECLSDTPGCLAPAAPVSIPNGGLVLIAWTKCLLTPGKYARPRHIWYAHVEMTIACIACMPGMLAYASPISNPISCKLMNVWRVFMLECPLKSKPYSRIDYHVMPSCLSRGCSSRTLLACIQCISSCLRFNWMTA